MEMRHNERRWINKFDLDAATKGVQQFQEILRNGGGGVYQPHGVGATQRPLKEARRKLNLLKFRVKELV